MRFSFVIAAFVAIAATASAQSFERNAQMRPGGDPRAGKCTIEVVVDGAAEVEVRGDHAILRNLDGQPPQWRRFECTEPLPRNPASFRFAGVDGRGRQELAGDPRNGGVAVVRIEDKPSGAGAYTFDLFWTGGFEGRDDHDRDRDRDRDRRRRMSADEAIKICQDTIRQQANERFRTRDVEFPRVALDNSPGRGEWVVGTMNVRRDRRDRDEPYRFSCSIDFESGQLRSAQIEPMAERR
jgi:hypothetical protein